MSKSFIPRLARAAAVFVLTSTIAHADVFYVTDSVADVITRINQAGAKTSYPAPPTGLLEPQQVVIDAAGNWLVADSALGKVMLIPAGGGTATPFGNDVPGAICLAFAPNGVLHVGSATDDTIRRYNAETNTFQAISTLPAAATVRSMIFNRTGVLFVADRTGNFIYEVPAGGGVAEEFSRPGDVTAPFAVAVDSLDKLYVSDAGGAGANGRIVSFKTNGNGGGNGNGNGNNPDVLASDLGDVRGLAFDQANTAYYLTGAGELRQVGATTPVAENLGAVQLLTTRTAGVTPIAYRGLIVPAVANARIGTLATPAMGNGLAAFKSVLAPSANLPAVNSANSLAMFRSQADGALELLARKSSAAPGTSPVGEPSAVFNTFADPILNNDGRVAFVGTLRSGVAGVTAANSVAVFSDYDGAALRPVMRRGQANLGNGLDPAVKLTGFRQLVLPDDAGPTVIATMAGPSVTASNNLGLFSLDLAGNLSLVLRSGSEISVGGVTRKLAGLTLFKPTVMSLGQARHFADNQTFTLAAAFTDGTKAVLQVKAGLPPQVVVEKGAPVEPLTPPAPTLAGWGSPAMSDDATFGFRGMLQTAPGSVTAATAPVIVSHDVVNTRIARAGASVPGVADAFFASLSDPVASPEGGRAFFARMRPGFGGVTSATSAGLWQDLGTGVAKVARQGEVAPGVPKAPKFAGFRQFVLPATGGVVFTATIAGAGITSANNLGLWANDGAGATELLLRKGDKLSIGGNMKTVTAFKIFTAAIGVTGQSRQFDDSGTVACHVSCSDGTQAVLAIQRP